jgi:hypothetical protein
LPFIVPLFVLRFVPPLMTLFLATCFSVVSADPGRFNFASGLISSPTRFSLDSHWGSPMAHAKPHPSFLISPGITLAYTDEPHTLSMSLAYHGKFDFYFGSLESGPVISRLQNPELFLDYDSQLQPARLLNSEAQPTPAMTRWQVRIGVGHESNGMFVETREQFDAFGATLPPGYNAQDFASMSWNYAFTRIESEFSLHRVRFVPQIILRLFTQHDGLWTTQGLEDSSLFYHAGPKPHIWDYDGCEFSLAMKTPGDFFMLRWWPLRFFPWSYGEAEAGWQTGGLQAIGSNVTGITKMFAHTGFHFTLRGRWSQLPWMGFLKYAHAYADPIAYYTLKSHTFSAGIEFNNFQGKM